MIQNKLTDRQKGGNNKKKILEIKVIRLLINEI